MRPALWQAQEMGVSHGGGKKRTGRRNPIWVTAHATIYESGEVTMQTLPPKMRLEVLELVTEIAASAAGNHNVQFMIEFQEELVERLYRKMSALLLEPGPRDEGQFND